MVIYLATGRKIKTSSAELVGISRLADSQMRAIDNLLHSIVMMSLSKIGQVKACDRRREFEQCLNR